MHSKRNAMRTLKTTTNQAIILISALLIFYSCTVHAQGGYFGAYFRHQATAQNSSWNVSIIDNDSINNQPYSGCIITACFYPDDIAFNYYPALFYDGGRWNIYNETTGSPIPENASFNVLAPSHNGNSFVHAANTLNITSYITRINNPTINNHPGALIFVTHDLTTAPVANNKAIGVFFNGTYWNIFNEDISAFPDGASFHIFGVDTTSTHAFLHTTTASSIANNISYLSNPILDHNPNAVIIITHNPVSGFGIYNNHPTGVLYNATLGLWGIFNEDSAAMPVGTSFNVLIANAGTDAIAEINNTVQNAAVYPTVASTSINIDFSLQQNAPVKICLLNAEGAVVKNLLNKNMVADTYHITEGIKDFSAGVYFVEISDGNNEVRKRFVVKR